MEFKLNKIDTELRKQVNEVAKDGKVHGADHNLNVNKDKNKNKEEQKKSGFKAAANRKNLTVSAVKAENLEIDAFSGDDEGHTEVRGRFLDIRK